MQFQACAHCEHPNPIGASYCIDCGEASNLKPCRQCGEVAVAEASHCASCKAAFPARAIIDVEIPWAATIAETRSLFEQASGRTFAPQFGDEVLGPPPQVQGSVVAAHSEAGWQFPARDAPTLEPIHAELTQSWAMSGPDFDAGDRHGDSSRAKGPMVLVGTLALVAASALFYFHGFDRTVFAGVEDTTAPSAESPQAAAAAPDEPDIAVSSATPGQGKRIYELPAGVAPPDIVDMTNREQASPELPAVPVATVPAGKMAAEQAEKSAGPSEAPSLLSRPEDQPVVSTPAVTKPVVAKPVVVTPVVTTPLATPVSTAPVANSSQTEAPVAKSAPAVPSAAPSSAVPSPAPAPHEATASACKPALQALNLCGKVNQQP